MNNSDTRLALDVQESIGLIVLLSAALVGPVFGAGAMIDRLDLWMISAWFGVCAILLGYARRPLFDAGSNAVSLLGSALSVKEKWIIAGCSVLSPSITGITVCVLWSSTHHLKARQANLIAITVLGVRILLHAFVNTPY